jgi:hypothetical protein
VRKEHFTRYWNPHGKLVDDNGEGQEAGKRLKLNQGDLPWEDLPVN